MEKRLSCPDDHVSRMHGVVAVESGVAQDEEAHTADGGARPAVGASDVCLPSLVSRTTAATGSASTIVSSRSSLAKEVSREEDFVWKHTLQVQLSLSHRRRRMRRQPSCSRR